MLLKHMVGMEIKLRNDFHYLIVYLTISFLNSGLTKYKTDSRQPTIGENMLTDAKAVWSKISSGVLTGVKEVAEGTVRTVIIYKSDKSHTSIHTE